MAAQPPVGSHRGLPLVVKAELADAALVRAAGEHIAVQAVDPAHESRSQVKLYVGRVKPGLVAQHSRLEFGADHRRTLGGDALYHGGSYGYIVEILVIQTAHLVRSAEDDPWNFLGELPNFIVVVGEYIPRPRRS